MILEISDAIKTFGGLRAVNGVSLQLTEGRITGLIGPNGAGKTTLFNLVAGVYSANAGRIAFQGNDITGFSPDRICHLGIARTFQIPKPIGRMTVLQNVMTAAFCRTSDAREARRAAEATLEFTGMSEMSNEPAHRLTTGSRKRLEVAKALVTKPKLVLLDEAAAGLNATEVKETMGMIERIRASGITVLWVEHVMEAVMGLSDWIIVLHHGIKIAEGYPRDISQDEKVIQAYLGDKYQYA